MPHSRIRVFQHHTTSLEMPARGEGRGRGKRGGDLSAHSALLAEQQRHKLLAQNATQRKPLHLLKTSQHLQRQQTEPEAFLEFRRLSLPGVMLTALSAAGLKQALWPQR